MREGIIVEVNAADPGAAAEALDRVLLERQERQAAAD